MAAPHVGDIEVKRHRQGLQTDEMGSSGVLDVTVFNLRDLARQTIQHQAEPRMLRLIMNQTSHIMMFVEGTSLAVNQWDRKLRARHSLLISGIASCVKPTALSVHLMTTTGLVSGQLTVALLSGISLTIAAANSRKCGIRSSKSP